MKTLYGEIGNVGSGWYTIAVADLQWSEQINVKDKSGKGDINFLNKLHQKKEESTGNRS